MLQVKSFTFSPVQENTYVLYNEERECCIIDPGCYFPEERDELKTGIIETGLTPVLLLNTHCHLDHVFGNKFVRDTWGLDLHIHQKEKPVLDFAPQSGLMWQLPFDNYDGPLVYLNGNPDVQIILDRIEPAGGQILVPKTEISPEYGHMAVFLDSEGNRIALHSIPPQ